MECNKDEAIRAMDIAKRKVTETDYSGARTFAVKAQNLYPQLDGLKQVLMLIDVYISAGNKINGGEPDWYGVLGVDPLADDGAVKKQYRKLALLLHPDKNKCEGAEGAFKLVLEAWSLLSDKVKRIAFDQRRRVVMMKEVKPRKSRKQKQEPKEAKQPTKKQKQPPKEPKQPAKKQPPKQPKQPAKKQKQPPKEPVQPQKQQGQPTYQPEQPTYQPEQPPKRHEQPPKQQEQPPKQHEQPTNQQEQPPKQQEQPPKQQEQPPKQQEPTNQQKQPAYQQGQATNYQEQPAKQQEKPPKHQEQQAKQQEQPTRQHEQPPMQEEKPPEQPKQPIPNQQEKPPTHQKQPANQQKQPPPNQPEQRPKQQKQQPSPQKQQPRQPSSKASRNGRGRSNKPTPKVSTFWTMCDTCETQQAYIRVYYLNKNVKCQSCNVSFKATEIEKTQQATEENTNGSSRGSDLLSRKASSNVANQQEERVMVGESEDKDEEAAREIENSDFKVEESVRKKLKTDGSCRGK